ncbi:MAG: hypothetical protein U0744_11955 [Gemmataceae bacterium]
MPFRIVTSSGDAYTVLHPEFAIVTKRWVAVATPAKPEDDEVDPDFYGLDAPYHRVGGNAFACRLRRLREHRVGCRTPDRTPGLLCPALV